MEVYEDYSDEEIDEDALLGASDDEIEVIAEDEIDQTQEFVEEVYEEVEELGEDVVEVSVDDEIGEETAAANDGEVEAVGFEEVEDGMGTEDYLEQPTLVEEVEPVTTAVEKDVSKEDDESDSSDDEGNKRRRARFESERTTFESESKTIVNLSKNSKKDIPDKLPEISPEDQAKIEKYLTKGGHRGKSNRTQGFQPRGGYSPRPRVQSSTFGHQVRHNLLIPPRVSKPKIHVNPHFKGVIHPRPEAPRPAWNAQPPSPQANVVQVPLSQPQPPPPQPQHQLPHSTPYHPPVHSAPAYQQHVNPGQGQLYPRPQYVAPQTVVSHVVTSHGVTQPPGHHPPFQPAQSPRAPVPLPPHEVYQIPAQHFHDPRPPIVQVQQPVQLQPPRPAMSPVHHVQQPHIRYAQPPQQYHTQPRPVQPMAPPRPEPPRPPVVHPPVQTRQALPQQPLYQPQPRPQVVQPRVTFQPHQQQYVQHQPVVEQQSIQTVIGRKKQVQTSQHQSQLSGRGTQHQTNTGHMMNLQPIQTTVPRKRPQTTQLKDVTASKLARVDRESPQNNIKIQTVNTDALPVDEEYARKLEEQKCLREEIKRKKEERRLMMSSQRKQELEQRLAKQGISMTEVLPPNSAAADQQHTVPVVERRLVPQQKHAQVGRHQNKDVVRQVPIQESVPQVKQQAQPVPKQPLHTTVVTRKVYKVFKLKDGRVIRKLVSVGQGTQNPTPNQQEVKNPTTVQKNNVKKQIQGPKQGVKQLPGPKAVQQNRQIRDGGPQQKGRVVKQIPQSPRIVRGPGPQQLRLRNPGPQQFRGPGPHPMRGPGPRQMRGPHPQPRGPGPHDFQGPMHPRFRNPGPPHQRLFSGPPRPGFGGPPRFMNNELGPRGLMRPLRLGGMMRPNVANKVVKRAMNSSNYRIVKTKSSQSVGDNIKVGAAEKKSDQDSKRVIIDSSQPRKVLSPSSRSVAIENMSSSTSLPNIRKLCSSVGALENLQLMASEKKAIAKFKSPEQAEQFVQKYNGHMVDLSCINVSLVV